MLTKQYLKLALAYLVEASLILISLLFILCLVYAGGEALKQGFIVPGLGLIVIALLPLALVNGLKDLHDEISMTQGQITLIKRQRASRR